MSGYAQPAAARPELSEPPVGPRVADGPERQARRLEVRGTVQGVGLRPFVCRLARQLGLDGTVRNAGGQVVIDAAGAPDAMAALLRRLVTEAPAPAHVADVSVTDLNGSAPVAGSGFRIMESPLTTAQLNASRFPPDLPTCAACMRELFDPGDRRFRYPFTNCSACGPRATIIEDLPYDRVRTTMAAFEMCEECATEYADPDGRRFHAEPLACPSCGPRLTWRVPSRGDGTPEVALADGEDALVAAVDMLAAGGIVAVKGIGGYQLLCDAAAPRTVARLRAGKGGWAKPFAVLVADLELARSLAQLSFAEEQMLESAARPIVLTTALRGRLPIAAGVNPGTDRIGLLLPYSPLHHLLAHDVDRPVVVTSGNRADEPIAIDDTDALSRLRTVADGFLSHDRGIRSRFDDSVGMVIAGRPVVVRRARGQAPAPLRLPVPARQPILAVGAQRAHTFALAEGELVTVSQHQGDLNDIASLEVFEEGLAHLSKLARVTPHVLVHDLHPGYLSTQYASRWPAEQRFAVQHHHAHVASCAAEHGVQGGFIGVAYDGIGLGDDGTFWGGEVLVADLRNYRRVGRFGVAPLPGGEAAVRRPAAMALGYLLGGERLGGAAIPAELVETFTARLPEREVDTVRRMVRAGVGMPLTSSAVSLVDAVASLLRLRDDVTYDGEAALVLEGATRGRVEAELPWRIVTADGLRVYDPTPTLSSLLAGIADGAPVSAMAAGFHATLATVTLALCLDAGQDSGLSTVCLSGELFANRLLTATVADALRSEGFEVYVNELVPTGEGGVSFGQAAVMAARSTSE